MKRGGLLKFAINYSHEARELIQKGLIDVDIFKCPDFDQQLVKDAQQCKPAYLHFDLNAGEGTLTTINWSILESLSAGTDTPFINLHLVAHSKDFPVISNSSFDSNNIDEIIDRVVKDIQYVVERFGSDRVILENVVYSGPNGDTLRTIVEPEIIAHIVYKTKCGLLLDIAHAQMTCYYSGEDVYEYLNRFPLDQLRELHITGIQKVDGSYRDSMPMTEEDWKLAEWSLNNIKQGMWNEPWVVSFEYGGVGPIFEWRTAVDVLEQQVPLLNKIVKN
ncbi:DUF692 family multinuclear iron-containing protein [Halobacillus seohaensis]|uniref:DUF692 family multinuclear iron-containing protein n=1 Tax=Halobacillus seohaensis TaxID=447421 RepID=A0ABW2EPS0_9BACI